MREGGSNLMRHSSERSLFLRLGSCRVGDAIARNSDGEKLGVNETEFCFCNGTSGHASKFGK